MPQFAQRITVMEGSATIIRQLFAAMGDPGVISFGGGAPAKEALPVEILREIAADILTREARGIEALQYGPPMGAPDLREVIASQLLAPKGVTASADTIMVVGGGLEAINLICQLYLEPGDVVLVEKPTFVHCVEIFEMFQARCISCEMDEDGLIMEDVEDKIRRYRPKIVYIIPTFQHPTGRTLSLSRRKRLAQLGSQYDTLILEDDPYRDIRYSGEDLPPIKAFDTTGHTVLANSFSKILSPGSRLGYVVADEPIMAKLFDAKTATNSHTGMISQVLCAEFFKRGYYPGHHEAICNLYRERRDSMLAAIKTFLPGDVYHTSPDGGLFIWLELPGGLDTAQLLPEAIHSHKVAYVDGAGFFTDCGGLGSNCMRISFGGVTPENIHQGMERLGRLIAAKL